MFMRKKLGLLALALVLTLTGCAYKTAKLKPQATALADKLGRTPSNMIVEFQTCGETVCSYDIYFTMADDLDTLTSRFGSVLSTPNDTFGSGTPHLTAHDLVGNLNSGLSTTSIKSRMTVTGSYNFTSANEWYLKNKQNVLVAVVEIHNTRDSSVSYAFGGKPLHGNIVHVESLVDTNN